MRTGGCLFLYKAQKAHDIVLNQRPLRYGLLRDSLIETLSDAVPVLQQMPHGHTSVPSD